MANIAEGTIKSQTFNAIVSMRVDQSVAGIIYVGIAEPHTLDSDKRWMIKRYTTVANITKVEFALPGNGTASLYSNVWNNRAILTYQ